MTQLTREGFHHVAKKALATLADKIFVDLHEALSKLFQKDW